MTERISAEYSEKLRKKHKQFNEDTDQHLPFTDFTELLAQADELLTVIPAAPAKKKKRQAAIPW